MQTPNRDLFVTDATRAQYKIIEPLLTSEHLDAVFMKHEKAANSAKRRYHKLGQIAIILITISAIFTIAEALVLEGIFTNVVFTFTAAIMVGIGIILQGYLIITRQKTKWLLNRFATERLRSLRFQAFYFAQTAKNETALREQVDVFLRKKIAHLENELNAGLTILQNFRPDGVLDENPHLKSAANPRMAELAREAYLELRVNYQRNFALSEITRFTGRRRILTSTQDMIYFGAAVFAFLSLGGKIINSAGFGIDTAWIDFLAVTLFILGATEAIMDNATLEEQSQSRFEQYVRDIDALVNSSDGKTSTFTPLLMGMERICLDELDLFCRAANRISYRF